MDKRGKWSNEIIIVSKIQYIFCHHIFIQKTKILFYGKGIDHLYHLLILGANRCSILGFHFHPNLTI